MRGPELICRAIQPGDKPELLVTAQADGHPPLLPTHVWTRAGKIVGYASIGAVTVLSGWAHRKEMSDAEALGILRFGQEEAARQGAQVLMIPTTPDCRFTPWLEADRHWKALTPVMKLVMRKV